MSLGFTFNGAPLSPPRPILRESTPTLPPIPTASPISSPSRAVRRQPEATAYGDYEQADACSAEDGGGGGDYGEYDEGAGYGAQDYGGGGAEEYEVEEDTLPAPMPGEYYTQVESFLMAPPPNLKAIVRKTGGGPPALQRQADAFKRPAPPPPKPALRRKGGCGSSGAGKGNSADKSFDFRLLEEALAYTQNLGGGGGLGDGFGDSGGGDASSGRLRALANGSPPRQGNPVQALRQARRRDSTAATGGAPLEAAPRADRSSSGGGSGGGGAYGSASALPSAYGSLKKKEKPPSKKSGGSNEPRQQARGASSANGSANGGLGRRRPGSGGGGSFGAGDFGGREEPGALGGGHNDAAVDVDSLVANFEQGLELQRLRAELAASRQRMAASTSALTAAAQQFYAQQPGGAGGVSGGKKKGSSSSKRR
jgi:hypothetical protein